VTERDVTERDVTPAPSRPGGADPDGWLRLSPRSLAIRPVIDLVRLLPVLLGLLFAGSRGGHGNYWGLAVAAVTIVLSVIRWTTTRYQITAERVYVQRGLLNQKVLSVARDRVRTVDLSAHILYRAIGLQRVAIGTGRSDRKDGESFRLDALTVADAEALRTTLLAGQHAPATAAAPTTATPTTATPTTATPTTPGATDPAATRTPSATGAPAAAGAGVGETQIARLHVSWVRYAPLTLTGLVILGVLAGAVQQFNDAAHINPAGIGPVNRLAHHIIDLPLGPRILVIAAAVAVMLTVVSSIGYLALFWDFQLTRLPGGALRVTRGLLSTRATTIDAQRLRGAEISEPLLLRAAGGARCIAITTGLRVGHGAERGGSLIMPPAPSSTVRATALAVLGLHDDLTAAELTRHGPRAARRRVVRAVGGAVLIAAVTATVVTVTGGPAWIWVATLALLPLGGLLAADRYRNLGHVLAGRWLVTRTGSLVRRRSIVSTEGVVGWRIHQSFFQRRQGLVTLTAATAAGRQRYEVHDVPVASALALADAAAPTLIGPMLTP
jgi:putative membrane protein